MEPLFEPTTSVRVLVVPVGRIRRASFQAALARLREHSHVALGELTPDVTENRSEFTGPTFPNGILRLSFVTEYDDEYVTLEEFQKARSVLAVVGIMHCGECGLHAVPECHAAFMHHVVPKFQAALVHRCLAFSPDDELADTIPDLTLIPTAGDLAFYTHTLVCDLATALLSGFQDMAASIEVRSVIHSPPPNALGFAGAALSNEFNAAMSPTALVTPGSPMSAAVTAVGGGGGGSGGAGGAGFQPAALLQTQEARLKKRAPGRAAKLVADLLLLAGKLPAAIDKYLEAMDAAKANLDHLWLAAAMEGLYTAMLTLRDVVPDAAEKMTSLPQPVREWLKVAGVADVESKFTEVVAMYERGEAPLLAAELSVRLAAVMHAAGRPRAATAALLTSGMDLGTGTGVSPRAQLALAVEAAALFGALGFVRKQALFLMLAVRGTATVLAEAPAAHVAPATQFQLMDKLAHLYGLLTVEPLGWPALQTAVLDDCIRLADAVEDASSLTLLIVKCFQRLQSMLSLDGMLDIVARLQRSSKGSQSLEGRPLRQFAFLKKIAVVPPSAALMPHKRAVVKADAAKDPFLYSAFAKRGAKDAPLHLVAGEPVAFKCQLVNPFSFSVTLEAMALLTEDGTPTASEEEGGEGAPAGVSFDPEPIDVSLPALGSVTVTLKGTPRGTGRLRVLGCEFRIFGVKEQCTLTGGPPAPQPKIKMTATEALNPASASRSAASHARSASHGGSLLGAPADDPADAAGGDLTWDVIDPLPLLRVRSLGAVHKCVVLLEGQWTDLALQVHNVGSLPVTSLQLQFAEHRTLPPVNESDPIAVHGADKYDLAHAALAVDGDVPASIPAGAAVRLPLRAFGKRGCTGVDVHLVYGIGGASFSRHLTTSLSVTVAPSVAAAALSVSRATATAAEAGDRVRVHVDFANQHHVPIRVRLQSSGSDSNSTEGDEEDVVTVQAGSTRRCAVTLPRCVAAESDLVAAIPTLKAKQFVMTKHGQLPANFREKTMCFWLKEYILSRVRASWTSDDGHAGDVDLAALAVDPAHIPLLWEQSIDVAVARVTRSPVTPHLHEVTLAVHNHADMPQNFLVQVRPDALAGVRLLGHPAVTLCGVPAREAREVVVRALGRPAAPWTLLCHAARVGTPHPLVSALKFVVPVPEVA
ncbi:hypothetical protein H9P43_001840 [Blastocladiella emersonii ATCC 22665]|nr:hypothetical protein H9P43_001840 [Blastocladiella emersonii ATCC 22665]